MLAVDRLDDQPLEHEAERAADERRSDRGEEEDGEIEQNGIGARPARERQQHQSRDIGAERDEGAVAEIEHVHHAEDQRQPRGHGEDHHAHRESRRGQRQEGRERADERRCDERDEDRRSAPAGDRSSAAAGRRRRRDRSLVRIQAQAEQAVLQRLVGGEVAPSRRDGRCGRCPSPEPRRRPRARRGNSARPAGSSPRSP